MAFLSTYVVGYTYIGAAEQIGNNSDLSMNSLDSSPGSAT